MFNIGFSELIVIGVIALLVIGPKQLPEVARILGRLITEFKKATQELSGGLLEVTRDVKNSIEETKEEILKEGRSAMDDVMKIDEEKEHEELKKLEEEPDGKS